MRAQGWGHGDEVVTSPLSFVASANCMLFEDAVPVFCDIDPRTLNMDPQAAEAACGERTAGLLPVHIFGYPADMPALEEIARARGLGIVEDACEAVGAVDAGGVRVGARGHPAAFGFYANKQLVTGEGGMLTAGDEAVLEQARSERNQGRGSDMDWLSHDRLGFNYRMSDVTAAIGVAQVERLDALLAERVRVASLYGERLASIEGLVLPCEDAGAERRSWFVYVVQVPEGVDRDGRDRAARRGRHRVEGLPAGDPPPAVLPRALRVPGRRVPGRGGGRGAVAGSAFLHGHGRVRGRAGGQGARGGPWPRLTSR